MKTQLTSGLFALIAMLLCSCSNDYENHTTSILPMNPAGKILFADQTEDSVFVNSSDMWKASKEGDWFTITPQEYMNKIPAGYTFTTRIIIHSQPNATGKVRVGKIDVDGYYKVGTLVRQLPYLNIISPVGIPVQMTDSVTGKTKDIIQYADLVPAKKNVDNLKFMVYSDNADLTSSVDWIVVPKQTLKKGENMVPIDIAENTGDKERIGQVMLVSNGVRQVIYIRQNAKMQKQ